MKKPKKHKIYKNSQRLTKKHKIAQSNKLRQNPTSSHSNLSTSSHSPYLLSLFHIHTPAPKTKLRTATTPIMANPISVTSSRHITSLDGALSGHLQNSFIGTGNPGVLVMSRVLMSLRSGIDTEIVWALSTLTEYSSTNTSLLNLESAEFVGHELMNYFFRPYALINEGNPVTRAQISQSCDALLSLRNLCQDLINQQWLSQSKAFKKHATEVVKFCSGWLYGFTVHEPHLQPFENEFIETFNHLLDLLEILSCYYIDNTKNDQLVQQILALSLVAREKNVVVSTLTILTHLLYTRDDKPEDDVEKTPNNCIDAITINHLETFANYLLIADNELALAALNFFNQYLSSDTFHPSHAHSVRSSRGERLSLLLQLKSTKTIFEIFVKQLPRLIVQDLPLSGAPAVPVASLSRRSQHSSIPSQLPHLPSELYDVIVKFPEPLRATTWLRCCYEPYFETTTTASGQTDVIPGEVTQISLWKAYEKQFEQVWQTAKTRPNPDWPPLLPAVDFIKNVNSAFPNSEAMVVTLDAEGDQPAKKKFIIKGIQPRQFVVNIDVANYEALKQKSASTLTNTSNGSLPIGHIDQEKFQHTLKQKIEQTLTQNSNAIPPLAKGNPVNTVSVELMLRVFSEVIQTDDSGELGNVFRVFNSYWLPDVVYANPALVQHGYIDGKWLGYLL